MTIMCWNIAEQYERLNSTMFAGDWIRLYSKLDKAEFLGKIGEQYRLIPFMKPPSFSKMLYDSKEIITVLRKIGFEIKLPA